MAEGEETETPVGAQADLESPSAPQRRIISFYALIAVVVAAGVGISIHLGSDEEPPPAIAGGYALAEQHPCLGSSFELQQSGQFVNIGNTEDSLSGRLTFEDEELDGDVKCLDGSDGALRAVVNGGDIGGSVAGESFEAKFDTEPPTPGNQPALPPNSIAGEYKLAPASECMGSALELEGDADVVEVLADEEHVGELEYSETGEIHGMVSCLSGGEATVSGEAADRSINLVLTPAEGDGQPPIPSTGEEVVAAKQREFGKLLAQFFIALAVILIISRLFGQLAKRMGQPQVMGEVVAGIVLGPTVFGALAPELQSLVFPSDIIPTIGVVANLGLIFYMFLVGLELDWRQLQGRVSQAALISNASVAMPMMLGIAAAVPIFAVIAPPGDFLPFALFMGVTMSITAFPVLARILVERRMLKAPLGAVVMAAAAVDDVTAWFLIALATAIAVAGTALDVLETVGLALVFCVVMFAVVRPLLARMSGAYQEVGRVPGGWIAGIFAGVLLSAYATESIGIALIFGAFVMGLVMPRHDGLTEDVTSRIEDFVVTLLLPLFFVYTGLRTNFGLLDRPELWLITAALVAIAIVAKLGTATVAARVSGFDWHASTVVGTLMNTRGLTELIVLNLALEKGVISSALFAALVIMALVTTFMAGPILSLIDKKNRYGAPVEDELLDAKRRSEADFPALRVPEQAILVAPQATQSLPQLRLLAEALARSEPPRELIVADLVSPPRGAASGVRPGLQSESRLLAEASREVHRVRDELVQGGIAARGVAFISADHGIDLARIAEAEQVDLLLMDGQRPLLGQAVPRGAVGTVLRQAPCDVAVLVAREAVTEIPVKARPVVVPFGAAEHDWAALELGAWICAATGAQLKLLGAASDSEDRSTLERRLGDAGLLVRQYAGIAAEPLIIAPGREAIVEAAANAGLLAIGLSSRWQQEGLGETRSQIARTAEAPILFVRRGTRPGALAPSEDVTRFSWSSPVMNFGGPSSKIGPESTE